KLNKECLSISGADIPLIHQVSALVLCGLDSLIGIDLSSFRLGPLIGIGFGSFELDSLICISFSSCGLDSLISILILCELDFLIGISFGFLCIGLFDRYQSQFFWIELFDQYRLQLLVDWIGKNRTSDF
ncbi:hypothetical protein RhiirB3_391608, partial [Rhizophagus irregularis]